MKKMVVVVCLVLLMLVPSVGTCHIVSPGNDRQQVEPTRHTCLLDNGTIACYVGDGHHIPVDPWRPDIGLAWLFLRNKDRSEFRIGLTNFAGEYTFRELPLEQVYDITAIKFLFSLKPTTVSVELTFDNSSVSIEIWLYHLWFS
jgi:hypothetical protein